MLTEFCPSSWSCASLLKDERPEESFFLSYCKVLSASFVLLLRSPTLLISKPRNLSLLSGEKGAARASIGASLAYTGRRPSSCLKLVGLISTWSFSYSLAKDDDDPSILPNICLASSDISLCAVLVAQIISVIVIQLFFKDGPYFCTRTVLKGGIRALLATLRESSDS